ncbi:MAG TPA: hypothetical protein VHX66_13005 [Solirubrobacteraceae bacterium]|jgi:hypothetical protein|nr:hypothetical protein [Solirubrobacteraceae bacterium]
MGEAGVLVVFRERRGGSRAIAAAIAVGEPLAIVAIAPRGEPRARCIVYTGALEEAIADAATRDLRDARAILGERAEQATFVLLAPEHDGDVAEWALRAGLRRAVVASRRLGRADPIARELARAGIEVSVAR